MNNLLKTSFRKILKLSDKMFISWQVSPECNLEIHNKFRKKSNLTYFCKIFPTNLSEICIGFLHIRNACQHKRYIEIRTIVALQTTKICTTFAQHLFHKYLQNQHIQTLFPHLFQKHHMLLVIFLER